MQKIDFVGGYDKYDFGMNRQQFNFEGYIKKDLGEGELMYAKEYKMDNLAVREELYFYNDLFYKAVVCRNKIQESQKNEILGALVFGYKNCVQYKRIEKPPYDYCIE